LIGVGIAELIKLVPTYGSMIEAEWSLQVFVRAIAIALILGLIGGIYPALRASRLLPVEALRYE
jgi:putative ABC transport system permease protein